MKKIEALIASTHLDAVRDALLAVGVDTMSYTEVRDLDPLRRAAWYRGAEYVVWFVPRLKLDMLVADSLVPACLEAIRAAGATDQHHPDIVVLPVHDAVRAEPVQQGPSARARHRRSATLRSVS